MKITKKAREEKAREIIDRNALDVPFSKQDVFEFSTACQEYIAGVVRKVNPQFPKDHRHLHMLIDGVWQNKSWRKMIYPISKEQDAKRIMRHAVRMDMMDFMDATSDKFCQHCFTEENLTVDHVSPPFDDIANEFIKTHGVPELDDPPRGQVINLFRDMDIEAAWVSFHASHACYQILCRSCNASKGKN